MMEINLNDEVMVKLTPYAIAVMEENHFNLFKGAKYAPRFIPPPADSEGWSRMQLWGLMLEFGNSMQNGTPNQCFEGNVVRLISEADC